MSTHWRIALALALVLLGVGGGTCALRVGNMIESRVEPGPDGVRASEKPAEASPKERPAMPAGPEP